LFSTMEIVLKIFSTSINPIQITFLRFLIGGVILLPFAIKELRKRNYHLGLKDFTFFALTGFVCVVISMVLFQMGIVYSQASSAAVLFSCNPVFVVLLAFLLLHEKIEKSTIFYLVISLTGIIILINPLHMSGSATGPLLSILSAISFALYSVICRLRNKYYGSIAVTCFSFLLGSLGMLVVILISHISPVSDYLVKIGLPSFASVPIFQNITLQTLPFLIYVGVFVTGLGYVFYFLAMDATSTATASLVFFIKPALAPILAFLTIHDPITLHMVIGILFIVAGSAISLVPRLVVKKELAAKT